MEKSFIDEIFKSFYECDNEKELKMDYNFKIGDGKFGDYIERRNNMKSQMNQNYKKEKELVEENNKLAEECENDLLEVMTYIKSIVNREEEIPTQVVFWKTNRICDVSLEAKPYSFILGIGFSATPVTIADIEEHVHIYNLS